MNIEAIVINYLRDKMETEAVYGEIPDSPKGEFFVIDKTGSVTENHICTSTVAIQSYGDSKARAAESNERLKEAMEGIVALDQIGGCHLTTDYNFTNTARKQYRYQAVYEITHY